GRCTVSAARASIEPPRPPLHRPANAYRSCPFPQHSMARHRDLMNLMPLGSLGAIESNGVVSFGLWLPWVSAADRNAVTVKIIHEADQFLQAVPAREFALTHSVRPPYGDFWSATVPIAGTAPAVAGSAWGTPGRYVYRYTIANPNAGTLDWIIDPF